MRNKISATVLGLALVAAGIWGVHRTLAQTSTGQYPGIVQKLVEKFGLKEADVQSVFDQEKQDRQAQIEARYEERLSELVSLGKITEDQKAKILAKHKDLQVERESQRSQIESQRTALEKWATDNGIDSQYLFGGFGGRGMGGMGGGHGRMMGW